MNVNKNLLCLKWDDFNQFVVNGLSNLFQKDEMADVTLFCDGRSFKAHKVILSIWSSYFKEIFGATSHPHPVIVLRETTSSDLELILRFIYQGQLFVPFEDTDRFLKTAEYFQIAGLRDMRGHMSSGGRSMTNFCTSEVNATKSHQTMANTNSSVSISQPFSSAGASYEVHEVNNNPTIAGIPIQIINNNSPQPHHNDHPSNINPISIITDNPSQGQFSGNVIKPNLPNRYPNPNFSRGQNSQPLPSSASVLNHSSSHNVGNQNSTGRQGQEIVYHSQPILIINNQKQSEYLENGKSLPDSRPTAEPVLVMERVSSGAPIASIETRKILPVSHPNYLSTNNGNTDSLAVYNSNIQDHPEVPEEVLGLAYLHENNSASRNSSHSQIIQEAAMAAGVSGVEDTEIMEINREQSSLGSTSTDSMTSSSRSSKTNNSLVLTSTTTSPVYAIKRVPQRGAPTPASKSAKSTTGKNASSNTFQPKTKRQHQGQTNESEMVNCPRCDKKVKKTSLKVHIKRTHLEEGTVLVCPICGKQISSKGVYYKHMYAHRQKSEPDHNKGDMPKTANHKHHNPKLKSESRK